MYKKTAVIGTLGDGFLGNLAPIGNTTPDATLLQYELAEFLQQGAKSVAHKKQRNTLAKTGSVEDAIALLIN